MSTPWGWHVYTALSGCERPVVYACTVNRCDGCANADPLYRSEAAAHAHVEEWEQEAVGR